MEEMIKSIGNIGFPAVLLIAMVKYFFKVDQDRARNTEELYKQFATESSKREDQFREEIKRQAKEYRERENILVLESSRREEILKEEYEKRELLLRQESKKREEVLINTIESFSKTIESIALKSKDEDTGGES